MIRKCNDPQNLDAYTDADWSGDSINRKSTSGGILKIGSATLREFTKGQSCQTLSSGESENYAAATTTAEALQIQRLLDFFTTYLGIIVREHLTVQRQMVLQEEQCAE